MRAYSAIVLGSGKTLALLAGGLDLEAVGVFAGRPLLAVGLDDHDAIDELARLTRNLPAVIIGVAASPWRAAPDGFDVLLTHEPDAPAPWVSAGRISVALAELDRCVRLAPFASVTLVQLLRLQAGLSVADALVAESLAYSLLQSGPHYLEWLASHTRRQRAEPATPPVTVSRTGGILSVTLNRPHVRNALNRAMRDQLVEALQVGTADPSVERIELRGAGPSFCSGGDLDEFGLSDNPVTAHLVRGSRSPAARMAAVGHKTVAYLHGASAGAGVELAAFAGRVIATSNATFELPEVRMGLLPGAGGTVSIARRIGRHRTAYLAITGDRIGSATALQWGLVDAITEMDR